MTEELLEPLSPAAQALLEAERFRPAPSPQLSTEVLSRVLAGAAGAALVGPSLLRPTPKWLGLAAGAKLWIMRSLPVASATCCGWRS